jgi:predicted anti-sigma-YlaC factor YlaD
MTCPRSHELLQRRLDGETIADAVLEAHLSACAECRARFAAARRLETGLALLPRPCPPAGLAARLVGRLGDEARALRRRRLLRRAAVAALAAAVLVAVGVWQFFGRTPAPPELTPPNRGPLVEDKHNEPSPVRIRKQVVEAGESVVGVFRRAVGQTRKVLPKVSGPDLADPMSELDKPAEVVREAGHNVGAGLELVAVPVRRAVGMLMHMPPLRGDDRPGI